MPISKITLNGSTLIDLSNDTVESDNLSISKTAHKSDGSAIVGNMPNSVSKLYIDSEDILHYAGYTIEPFHLRVMTYNTGGWYIGSHTNVPTEKLDAYTELQNNILETEKPDIAVFQEWWHYFSGNTIEAQSIIGSNFASIIEFDRLSANYGKAIASKHFPLSGYSHFRFNVYDGTEWFYGFERAYIEVNGKRICIINTWLDSSDDYYDNRKSEVSQLLDYLATETSFILMGDFNVTCSSVSDAKYIDFIKPFVDAGYNVLNNALDSNGNFVRYYTYFGTADPNGSKSSIDQIITSSDIVVDSVFVDQTKQNSRTGDLANDKIDHVPFLADLIIN